VVLVNDSNTAGASVVIADDDPDILVLVAIAVDRAGLRVVARATDGDAALAAIREHRPDLAILDVAMPERSGIEVVRELRADPAFADLRVLLLSASVEESAVELGISSGADYFMAKPFSPRELTAWLAVGKEPRP
jgi:DNA-binding response OmpR family regulator